MLSNRVIAILEKVSSHFLLIWKGQDFFGLFLKIFEIPVFTFEQNIVTKSLGAPRIDHSFSFSPSLR